MGWARDVLAQFYYFVYISSWVLTRPAKCGIMVGRPHCVRLLARLRDLRPKASPLDSIRVRSRSRMLRMNDCNSSQIKRSRLRRSTFYFAPVAFVYSLRSVVGRLVLSHNTPLSLSLHKECCLFNHRASSLISSMSPASWLLKRRRGCRDL